MTIDVSDSEVHDIGIGAYTYLYPIVTMEMTRLQMTNVAEPSDAHAPMNAFAHIRQFPTADFRDVVRPNFDTLYSAAWLDLRGGPIVVAAGEDTDGRYYELPIYDMWTDGFAVPGRRTSGTGAGTWAVVPSGWSGTLPDGVVRIDAPTPIVWMIGRTQTNGPSDYPAVHAFQDQLTLTPLDEWGAATPSAPPVGTVDAAIDMTTPPLDQVNGMGAATFFDRAMALVAIHPPHLTDGPITMQMRRLGLVPGATFDNLDERVRGILSDVPSAALQSLAQAVPRIARVVNGWQMNIDTMGVYGNSYVKRSIVCMIGLGANSPEDAVYPVLMSDADGNPLDGANDYVIHFPADALPPVNAFWSVTMYDAQGFQVANPIDRFAIGDRDPLRFNADGSLDLFLQATSPGAERESNWLPSASGELGVTMRLYSPKPSVLDGSWNPPAVEKS